MFGSSGFGSSFGNNPNQQNTNTPFGAPAQPNTGFGFGAAQPPQQTPGFGGAPSAFGQSNTGAFGAPPSAFGASTGGTFGQPTANTGGFGQATTGFGQTTAAPSLFSNAPPTSTSAFGQPAASGSLFGAAKTGFGAPSASTSAFGAPQQTLPSAFGSAPSAFVSAPVMGAGAQQQTSDTLNMGTGYPSYLPTHDKEGALSATNIFHSVSAMPAYKNWSYEELRVQDYLMGKKFSGASQSSQPSGLGQPAPSPFGASTTAFGQTAPSNTGFGSTNTFGQTPPAPSTTGFGGGAFGQPQAPSTGLFGSSQPASTGFGAPQPAATGFGQAQPSSGFGSANTPKTGFGATGSGLFGQPSAATSAFGSTATTGSMFGQKPAAPTTSTGFGFGGTPSQPAPSTGTMGTGLFGQSTPAQQPSTGLFGQQPTNQASAGKGFGFGAGTTPQTITSTPGAPATGLFGQQQMPSTQPATGLFGQQPTANNQPATGLFGSAPAPPTTGASTLGFGSSFLTPAQNTGGGLFGSAAKPSTGLGFGSTTAATPQSTGMSLFGGGGGTNVGMSGGTNLFGSSLSTPVAPQTQLQASIDKNPYGNNPLFNVPVTAGGTGSTTGNQLPIIPIKTMEKKPAPPSSVTMTPRTATKLKLRGFTPTPVSRKSDASPSRLGIFESSSVTRDNGAISSLESSLQPRRSVKKLVLNDLDVSSSAEYKYQTPSKVIGQEQSVLRSAKKTLNVTFDPHLEDEALDTAQQEQEVGLVLESKSPAKTIKVTQRSPKSKQTLSTSDYSILPPLSELMEMSDEELQNVVDFEVSVEGIGSVKFLCPVDLLSVSPTGDRRGIKQIPINIVQFAPRVCTVYPDEESKPPVGLGLNVPADIRLYGCWCKDRSTGEPVLDEDDPRYDGHLEKLENMADTHFIGFHKATGCWRFKVEHFSRYGLLEEDEGESQGTAGTAVNPPKNLSEEQPSSFFDQDSFAHIVKRRTQRGQSYVSDLRLVPVKEQSEGVSEAMSEEQFEAMSEGVSEEQFEEEEDSDAEYIEEIEFHDLNSDEEMIEFEEASFTESFEQVSQEEELPYSQASTAELSEIMAEMPPKPSNRIPGGIAKKVQLMKASLFDTGKSDSDLFNAQDTMTVDGDLVHGQDDSKRSRSDWSGDEMDRSALGVSGVVRSDTNIAHASEHVSITSKVGMDAMGSMVAMDVFKAMDEMQDQGSATDTVGDQVFDLLKQKQSRGPKQEIPLLATTERSFSFDSGLKKATLVDCGLMLGRSFRVCFGSDGSVFVPRPRNSSSKETTAKLNEITVFKPLTEVASVVEKKDSALIGILLDNCTVQQCTVAIEDNELVETTGEEEFPDALIVWKVPAVVETSSIEFDLILCKMNQVQTAHSNSAVFNQREMDLIELLKIMFDPISIQSSATVNLNTQVLSSATHQVVQEHTQSLSREQHKSTQDDEQRQVLESVINSLRKEYLSRWLQKQIFLLKLQQETPVEQSVGDKIFNLLAERRLSQAITCCLEEKQYNLALVLSQIGCKVCRSSSNQCSNCVPGRGVFDESSRQYILNQLILWKKSKTSTSRQHSKILQLISGEYSEWADILPGMHWQQVVGLLLWYFEGGKVGINECLKEFEFLSEKYNCKPVSLHSIPASSSISNPSSSHPHQQSPQLNSRQNDMFFELIRLRECHSLPIERALEPTKFTLNALDFRFPWWIMFVLTRAVKSHKFQDSIQFDSDEMSWTADRMTISYINQLEASGRWLECLQLSLFVNSSMSRIQLVQYLISKYYPLKFHYSSCFSLIQASLFVDCNVDASIYDNIDESTASQSRGTGTFSKAHASRSSRDGRIDTQGYTENTEITEKTHQLLMTDKENCNIFDFITKKLQINERFVLEALYIKTLNYSTLLQVVCLIDLKEYVKALELVAQELLPEFIVNGKDLAVIQRILWLMPCKDIPQWETTGQVLLDCISSGSVPAEFTDYLKRQSDNKNYLISSAGGTVVNTFGSTLRNTLGDTQSITRDSMRNTTGTASVNRVDLKGNPVKSIVIFIFVALA